MAEEEVVILEEDKDSNESEEITELEPDEDEGKEEEKQKSEPTEEKTKGLDKKKLIIIFIIFLTIALVILTVTVLLLKNKKSTKTTNINTTQILKNLIKKEQIQGQFSPSKIENLIKKANILYEKGKKNEALKIYKQISTYNEALSFYNIGVVKMREKDYKGAIKAFKKAISNGEQKCISAINAAVSALNTNNKKLFKYYIDLAYTFLPDEINTPLYTYEMGLINYYKDFYYESLSAFSHSSSTFYQNEQNYLSSKILSFIGKDKEAINRLLKINNLPIQDLPLGLLYARIGEYSVAKKHLLKALEHTNEPVKLKIALALVENKLGNLQQSAKLLNEAVKSNPNKALSVYPIKVTLKKSLFDVNIAQKDFEKELFFNNKNSYSMLFYFAPYKIFDSSQTVNYIRKGSMNIFIDELGSALNYLKASSSISKVNISINKGIKKALKNHIYQANKIFKSLIKEYPKHSILHYNLALSYAQIGNYSKAYKHFSISYHLDSTNHLAGSFAIMCAKLIKKDTLKLSEDVKESIVNDKNLKDSNLFISLIHLTQNNQFALSRWLEEKKKSNPLNLALDIIISQKVSNTRLYKSTVQKLYTLLPKDILTNIIYFHMMYKDKNVKEYAKHFQIYFYGKTLDFNSFYYGSQIVKTLYIKLLQISGLLFYERTSLINKVKVEQNDIPALLHTLAYLDIFTNKFEESYTLYNQIIDEYNQRDSQTLFLASVASIGARHVANAIALLELSKLTDPNNNESRYALGLLYQEVKNFKGASIQYTKIGDKNFHSRYFSFTIVN